MRRIQRSFTRHHFWRLKGRERIRPRTLTEIFQRSIRVTETIVDVTHGQFLTTVEVCLDFPFLDTTGRTPVKI